MSYAINVENLKKSYNGNIVLKGLNFSVNKGEIFALLGVNGAGKTTALECIEGLKKYDSGKILVTGNVGIQLQSSSLPSHIKASEAVQLFARWNKIEVDKTLLESLGINELAKKQYGNMSTGQKRRLHLALALLSNPDVIFLDEPTAGLDVEGRVSLHSEIRKLKAKGKTIIMASHDMAEVENLCDRIAILKDGKIVFLGSANELTEKIGQLCNIVITTDVGEEIYPTQNIGESMLKILEGYKSRGVCVLDIKINRGTLEDHFISIAKSHDDMTNGNASACVKSVDVYRQSTENKEEIIL